jgi:cytidylate kinase
MSVITISRGSFSGGKILAECLGRRLGYRCIDRDVIVQRAAELGASEKELKDALEKPPGFLERFQHKRYRYLALIQAALTEEVRTGRAIYHGLAGHLLLKGGTPILRTRIIAPLEVRIQMLQERLDFSRSRAIAYIENVDADRRKWTRFLYGVDWGDASLYDLVLNLEYIKIEDACSIIASIVTERCFEFTPECQQRMDDLALGSRVRANLAIDPATSDLEVEVVAHSGAISVRGQVATIAQIEEVRRVATGTPGVASLDLTYLAPPIRA